MINNIFLSVLEISLSTSLIVLALIALSSLLSKRYAAKWKYWIWIFLALRLIIPINPTEILMQMAASSSLQPEKIHADSPLSEHTPSRRIVVEIPAQMTASIMPASEENHTGITLLDIGACVWFAGGLIIVFIHLLSYFCYRRLIMKRGKPVVDSSVLHQFLALKNELHIKSKVSIVKYSEAVSPMIIGFIHPVLVLPEESYCSEELRFILKHELVHLKRRDVYIKLLFVVANAVHWFNPLIWIMQKEAVVDMELSCDERVIRGANYDVRKAYTEALLSTLHKKCSRKTVLSTQFYGGKQIMIKRFKNILTKTRKRNGLLLLAGSVILAVSLGMLIGCSVNETDQPLEEMVVDFGDVPEIVLEKAKELASGRYEAARESFAEYHYSNWRIESLNHCYTYENFNNMVLQVYQMNYEFLSDASENVLLAGGMTMNEDGWVTPESPDSNFLIFQQEGESLSFLTNMFEDDCFPGDEVFTSDLKQQLGITEILTFSVEGEKEEVPATIFVGEGYSICIADGQWRQYAPDAWAAVDNDQVQFWITHFKGKSFDQVEGELSVDGYEVENLEMNKQEGEILYKVRLHEIMGEVWGVFYCYPVEAEEGWGSVLPVIVETFNVTGETNNR